MCYSRRYLQWLTNGKHFLWFFYLFLILDRTKKLQNRTFDSNILATDISKFVSTSDSVNNDSIRVLSSFDDKTNAREYLSFQLFSKYSGMFYPRAVPYFFFI